MTDFRDENITNATFHLLNAIAEQDGYKNVLEELFGYWLDTDMQTSFLVDYIRNYDVDISELPQTALNTVSEYARNH